MSRTALPRLLAAVITLLVVATVPAVATRVDECSDKSSGRLLKVDVDGCKFPPCLLKKNTVATVTVKFIVYREVKELKNSVIAKMWYLPFGVPFVGVDGESSCGSIYTSSGNKAGCPLKANRVYVYKFSVPVNRMYPSVSPLVHWGLLDDATGTNVACFQVKARIAG